jgi:hypothetical protein
MVCFTLSKGGLICANYFTVNELSNTIDLQSTLVRAESLFRRFQRTVAAIDKKNSFPAPNVRQRKLDAVTGEGSSSSPNAVAVTVTGNSVGKTVAQGIGAEKQRVISPELRQLLSRKVEVMNKEQVVVHGGGVL